MGVPKFYRWISERYPCLSETVKEYQIPEFDNLYLDMNGIIHNCSHPNDDDIHFRISEETMFKDIFHYLEVLFRLIRPQKVFFMAIDGVAPRAKMNQQRGRRFRSAKEAEDKEKEALRKGEVLPEEKRFDSNCITPGTEFMVKLQKQLEYFVSMKLSTDPLWQKTQVILSGHQVPGEGEHKIMEFIRHQKSQPDYNVDTRHCLYGLDADLMMLGLCSHEPLFSLLREEVKFGGKKNEKRVTTPEETTFHLLHLSLLREYLDLEFTPLKSLLPFPYDLERIIDDWVLMGFLVGNDFIPNLPHFHINTGALPMLYSAYMEVLPKLDGYINEGGSLNLKRFEKFMESLARIDEDHFTDTYADIKFMQGRHGRKQLVEMQPAKPVSSEISAFLAQKQAEVDELLGDETSSEEEESEEDDYDDDDDYSNDKQFQAEFKAHKSNYYKEKLEYDVVDGDVLRSQAEGYVRAIQWILSYYYNGVCSWSWFYPHHYAPYVSDIRQFASSVSLDFDLGKPFLPYEQLLGVLPAASKALLPTAHHMLMSSTSSPIYEFYPTNFETDKNGKQQDWEAVVLIPFIDENRLISAMKDCEPRLSDEERKRNQHGPMQVYVYTEQDLGPMEAPAYFPPIPSNHCQCTERSRDCFVVPFSKLVKGLHPKFTAVRYVPGFPSFRHLNIKGTLKKSGVVVFNMASQNESQIIKILQEPVEQEPDVEELGRRLCGRTIFVSWPHLIEARIVAISSSEVKSGYEVDAYLEGGGVVYKLEQPPKTTQLNQKDADVWHQTEKEIRTRYATRWGVDIGETKILVYTTPIIGRKYVYTQAGRVTLEKQWSPIPVPYALQATVQDLLVNDSLGRQNQYSTLAEVFTPGSTCFMLGQPGYGLLGKVLPSNASQKGKVRIELENIHDPDNEEIKNRILNSATTRYMPGFAAAQRLGINGHLLARLTGTIFLQMTPSLEEQEKLDNRSGDRPTRRPKKLNVGLGLKFNKSNEEVIGYSKKVDNQWTFSLKTIEVIRSYMSEFPELFDYLASHTNADDFTDVQVFGKDQLDRAKELEEFMAHLPTTGAQRQSCGAATIESELLPLLIAKKTTRPMKLKPLVMQVKPHLLFKPDMSAGSSPPDPSSVYELLDRVVNVRLGYSVPLGLRGTIIGIKHSSRIMDVLYEVLFDEPFSGALPMRGAPKPAQGSDPVSNRVYHLPIWAMINLSHGRRQNCEREKQGKPTAVVRPSGKQGHLEKPTPKAANQHGSYKAAVEAKPTPPQPQKLPPPPKVLARPKAESAPVSGNRVAPSKTAPSPSALPASPFLDIWNSLVQQHEQHQANSQAAANKNNPPPPQQPQQSKQSQQKEAAPKVPTLQEAARNLPKISKPGNNKTRSATAPAAKQPAPTAEVPVPSLPATIKQAPPLPPISTESSLPLGPSLSVQQLFDMAGQQAAAAIPVPVFPAMPMQPMPPPPPIFSFCLQLMDITQRKGLGVPLYTFMPLPDGGVMAEISLASCGVIARGGGKNNQEASEIAASVALRSQMIGFQPMMMPVGLRMPLLPPMMPPMPLPMVPQPMPPRAHPPGVQMIVNRGGGPPVPSSFVPMQVTRKKTGQQQNQQPNSAQSNGKDANPSSPQVPSEEEDKQTATTQVVSTPERPATVPSTNASKPPGSRLAIRFNGP